MYLHSNFSMKQVYHNIKNCCISLYRPRNQYIFVRLQIKYLSKAGLLKVQLSKAGLLKVQLSKVQLLDFWKSKTFKSFGLLKVQKVSHTWSVCETHRPCASQSSMMITWQQRERQTKLQKLFCNFYKIKVCYFC